jgi:bacteriocin-associated integral membrane protein
MLLIIASMLSFFILFNNEQLYQINEMEKAEQQLKYNYIVLMPSKLSNSSQQDVYEKIKSLLNKYNGNIYYDRVSDKQGDIKKFVYITNFEYFTKFALKNGRFFSNSDMETEKFLSSKESNNPNQIGTIATFAGENKFEIHTLNDMVREKYLLDGYCNVSFKDNRSIDLFMTDLKKAFNTEDFKVAQEKTNVQQFGGNIKLVIPSIYCIVMLLVLYDILKSYKTIGIEKLMGFSTATIYGKRILKIAKIQSVIAIVSSLIMTIFMFKDINKYLWVFLYKLLKINLIELIGLIILCSIPFLYLDRINISNMLKNKQPTNQLIFFNFIAKIVFLVILIVSVNKCLTNFNIFREVFTNTFSQWEGAKNYAVIPNLSNISDDVVKSKDFRETQKKMYLEFNDKGAILANFGEYLPDVRAVRLKETKYDYERDNIVVNPNYLKKYPLYDINNKEIFIEESEKNYVVLVPYKYKEAEKDIKRLFQLWLDGSPKDVRNQAIKIIWTKPNQKLFSMSIDVNPNEGNYVVDPIVHVLTKSNGTLDEYRILAIKSNPFKIKINDNLDPRKTINPVLEKFGYDRYVDNVSTVGEQIDSKAKDTKKVIAYLSLTIALLGVCVAIIIFQSIYNFFEKYKHIIAIRRLNGYKKIDKYKEHFILVLIGWVVVIIYDFFINKINLQNLLSISFMFIIIEIIMTLITLKVIEKRKFINIIKGAD